MSDAGNVRQLWEGWRPPPELERSRPRPVRLSGRGKGMLFLILALLIAAGAGGVSLYRKSARESQRDRLLAVAGSDGEARITRLWRGSGKDRRCYAAYQFSAGDAVIGKTARVPCERFTEGQQVRIRYLAASPETSRLADVEVSDRPPVWVAPLVGVALVGVALLVARRVGLERRLLEDGQAAPGVITKLGLRTDKGRKVHYEFATYSGTRIKGSYGPVRGKDVLPVGSPVVILYARDNPKLNTRYPPILVKLDY
ncbi:MAG TPA: DUF3592 domain-containing protein [Bryobacteraceae bacterium]|nr:DUF3592 domain-containing protein [Bryobacteraceae bacterium]